MSPKEKEPVKEYKFESADQEYLYAILGELRKQRKTINSMNSMVQVIGWIVITSLILTVIGWFLGGVF